MFAKVVMYIVTGLAILVNGVILCSFMQLIYDFLPASYVPGITAYSLSAICMITIVILGLTPFTDLFLRFIYGFRKPVSDEYEKIHRLFSEVCESAGKTPKNYLLYVVDEPSANAYALGINSVGLTRHLLKNHTEAQIKGVIAHELGHLHYGDSVHLRIFVTVSLIGQFVLIAYQIISQFSVLIGKLPIPILNLIPTIFGFFLSLFGLLLNLLIMLPLTIGTMLGLRQCEYQADAYAVKIGHGEGLKSFLYQILDYPESNNGLFNLLQASHPKTGKRILELEKDPVFQGCPNRQ